MDPVRVTYEIIDSVHAMEMLTITTLRNLMGSMDLQRARASRVEINSQLTQTLGENAVSWGIAVTRAEIKAIETDSGLSCT